MKNKENFISVLEEFRIFAYGKFIVRVEEVDEPMQNLILFQSVVEWKGNLCVNQSSAWDGMGQAFFPRANATYPIPWDSLKSNFYPIPSRGTHDKSHLILWDLPRCNKTLLKDKFISVIWLIKSYNHFHLFHILYDSQLCKYKISYFNIFLHTIVLSHNTKQ